MRGTPCRKKLIQNREMITMDCRRPGEAESQVLDVIVPALSPAGERGRLMRSMPDTHHEHRGVGKRGLTESQSVTNNLVPRLLVTVFFEA